MTKADIVNSISDKTGIDKTTILNTVEAFMASVKESLAKEENVYLRGFGSFILKNVLRKQRVIYLRTRQLSFRNITYPHLSRQRLLCRKSNNQLIY